MSEKDRKFVSEILWTNVATFGSDGTGSRYYAL